MTDRKPEACTSARSSIVPSDLMKWLKKSRGRVAADPDPCVIDLEPYAGPVPRAEQLLKDPQRFIADRMAAQGR